MQTIDIPKPSYDKGLAKYSRVKQGILDFIKTRNLQEGYRFPSAEDLSEIFGVNRLTANRAMEELAREGVVERIPGVGSILKKTQQEEHIGILIPSLLLMEKESNRKEWFVSQQVMQGIMKGLAENRIEWEIIELSTMQSPFEKIRTITDRKINGILFVNHLIMSAENDLSILLRKKKIPFVAAYNTYKITDTPSVFVDKKAGIKKGLQHLIEHGHRKIAYVERATPDGTEIIPEIFSNVFQEHGMETRKDWIWTEDAIPSLKQKIAETGVTGIFFSRDLSAIEAIKVLENSGIQAGKDVAVVGYDNIAEAPHCSPPLTTVDPHRTTAGYYAVKMLLSEMNNAPTETIKLVPDLVIRESCGCRKK